MTKLMLLVLAAMAVNCTPAICAEASDQEHEEDTVRRSPAHTAPRVNPSGGEKAAVKADSPVGSVTPNLSEPVAPSNVSSSRVEPPSGNAATAASTESAPAQTTPTGNQTSTAATGPVAGTPPKTTAVLPSEPVPGPYENDRRKVRNWLLEAKKRGVGLNAYIPVWDDMESTVKSGGSDTAVKTKLDAICRSIGDQVKNSTAAQRFRPVKPQTAVEEGVEVVKVKWTGEKGSDPLFRDKADAWYQKAKSLLTPDERADPQLQRRLHDQRDVIYKEMSERYASEGRWAPRLYKNMNQDMGAVYSRSPYSQRNYADTLNNDLNASKWYGGTESATPSKNPR